MNGTDDSLDAYASRMHSQPCILPHRCGQHCNQVLNRCAGIVDAAAETSSALAGATDHFCSLALSSAQKLIGLLTSRAAGLLTAKAAVEALKQMYHIQLRTHVSREMFLGESESDAAVY